MPMEDLQDKVAVVTGGASGIGLALVRAFATRACGSPWPTSTTWPSRWSRGVRRRRQGAGAAHGRDQRRVGRRVGDAVYDGFGACNVLCNNAGVGAPSAKVWQTTPNDWAWVFGVNVTGVVNGILTFVPRMLESGEEGHVVNTSSSDGPISPLPAASVYAASKAAVSAAHRVSGRGAGRGGRAHRRLGVLSLRWPAADGSVDGGSHPTEGTGPGAATTDRGDDTGTARGDGGSGWRELHWQPLDELAALVVEGIRAGRFVVMKDAANAAATLRNRAEAFAAGDLPVPMTHLG